MKALDLWELKSYVNWLNVQFEGAQLQNVTTNDQQICLEFYRSQSLWLVLHLSQMAPLMLQADRFIKISKKTKPVGLFLSSHAKNLRWQAAEVQEEQGRVVRLSLGNSKKKILMDIVLVPKAANVFIELIGEENKKISWEKPKPLGVAQVPSEHPVDVDWESWNQKVLEELFGKTSVAASNSETPADKNAQNFKPLSDAQKSFERALDKKKKALQMMTASLDEKSESEWRELGEALKSNLELDLNKNEKTDPKLSRSENMQRAFQKAKDLVRKRLGTAERIEILKQEIVSLEKKLASPQLNLQSTHSPTGTKPTSKGLLEKAKSQGRRLNLEPGYEAVIGKSGKDNLEILRKANSWDLWLHLKDYPGAHAIIHSPKGKAVSQAMIEQVALWVAKESLRKSEMGGVYDVIVVEARFVRPIKGDKLGRVTYHNPKSFRVVLKSASTS